LSNDGILTNNFLYFNCGTLQMRIALSREYNARESYWRILYCSIFSTTPLVRRYSCNTVSAMVR
jgi:hypothetical protein